MGLEKLKQIHDGYKNLLKSKVNLLPEDLDELAKHRYDICKACPAKTKCEQCSCPEQHW